MRYLKACQKESQRLLPVVAGSARQTKVDICLGGYQVPVGTKVIRWGIIASTCSTNFARPDTFIPERWIRGSKEHQLTSPYAFLPFGHGKRLKTETTSGFTNLNVQVLYWPKICQARVVSCAGKNHPKVQDRVQRRYSWYEHWAY